MRRSLLRHCLLPLFLLTFSAGSKADLAYFGLEPDIVTNYLTVSSKKLPYVRVTVELMIEDAQYLEIVEHHAPLLRSIVIDIIGKQQGDRIKSLNGREEIRQMCLTALREEMKAETGSSLIKNVIFTKYLYQE